MARRPKRTASWEAYRTMDAKKFRNMYRERDFNSWVKDAYGYREELLEYEWQKKELGKQAYAQGIDLCEFDEYQQAQKKATVAGVIVQRLIDEGLNSLAEFSEIEGSNVRKKDVLDVVKELIHTSMK